MATAKPRDIQNVHHDETVFNYLSQEATPHNHGHTLRHQRSDTDDYLQTVVDAAGFVVSGNAPGDPPRFISEITSASPTSTPKSPDQIAIAEGPLSCDELLTKCDALEQRLDAYIHGNTALAEEETSLAQQTSRLHGKLNEAAEAVAALSSSEVLKTRFDGTQVRLYIVAAKCDPG
jgi:hypothetical protein